MSKMQIHGPFCNSPVLHKFFPTICPEHVYPKLQLVVSLVIKKWVRCALAKHLKLCMVAPIGVNCQTTKRPKMDMSHGLIFYRPDCDGVISPVRFRSILVKQI